MSPRRVFRYDADNVSHEPIHFASLSEKRAKCGVRVARTVGTTFRIHRVTHKPDEVSCSECRARTEKAALR